MPKDRLKELYMQPTKVNGRIRVRRQSGDIYVKKEAVDKRLE